MPILIQCPNPVCAASSSVPEALNGRGVKCKRCGTPFKATPTLDGESNETQKSKPSSSGNPFPTLPAEFGRYHVTKLLGRGGMGAVYLARDTQLGRQVALKLPSFDASDTRRVERFVREAQAAAGLMHPNICPVFDAGKIDGRPFITMGYIDGNSLDSQIDPDTPMDETRAVGFARKVAAALHAAHETGIVHRDLKPANVMLTAKGEPVVMDFGLAKRVTETDANEAKLTHDGAVMGTPSYMAPEQVRGELERIGPATDVYSLGVMLFEMLTGRTPYTGPLGMVMGQILIAPVRRPSELRPDIDPQLDDACHKAMAKEPADRFPNMVAFGAALDEFLQGPDPASISVSLLDMKAPATPFADIGYDLVDEFAPETPKKPRQKVTKASSRLPLFIAAGFLGLVLLVGGIMLSVKTKYGDVVIDLGDNVAGVEVKIDGARVELTGIDKPITLTAGEHGLTVTGADFETLAQSFTVKKNEKQVVKVTLKPKAVAVVGPAPRIVEPTAGVPKDGFTIGRVWVGNRTYTKGSFAPGVVPYELHIQTRVGAKFTGQIFDNGSGRNMSTVTGEVTGEAVRWTEQSSFTADMLYETTGTLSGTTIRATQVGKRGGGWTGDTALELVLADGPVKTEKGVPYVFPPAGFTPLFNGKDLTGWAADGDCTDAEWKADAGGIAIAGGPQPTWGFLLGKQDYTDFVLRMQFQQKTEGAKSGVIFRGVPGMRIGRLPYQCKVNLQNAENTGSTLWGNKSEYKAPDQPAKLKPVGEWNDVELDLRGQILKVTINGDLVQTIDFDAYANQPTALAALKRPAGRIGLQKHLGDVKFRNIEIKDLTAPVAGFMPLFNGKDLTGWKIVGVPKWKWENDRLLGSPATPSGAGILMTDAEYDDFEIELQYRVAVGANTGLFLRTDPNCRLSGDGQIEVQIIDDEFPEYANLSAILKTGSVFNVFSRKVDPPYKRGDWNALRVRLEKRQIQVWVNGTQTVDADLDSARDKFATVPGLTRTTGRIGLQQNQKSDVEFKDVRVKRLDAKVSTNTAPDKPAADVVTLFDGKTLLGFQAQTAWGVTDGALKSRKGGSAFTEKTYADFTLEMEFKIEPDTMASIDILAEPGDVPAWIMLDNTRDAMAVITHNAREKGFVVHRLKPSAELKPAAEWNALTIALRDPMLSVTLNGKTLSNENIRNHLAWWRGGNLPAGKLSGRIGLTKRFGKGELLIRKLDVTTSS